MPDLTVAIVQDTLDWEQPEANRQRFAARLDEVAGADLAVLPEMFSSGFTMNAAGLAETMDGPTVAWLRGQAAARNLALAGSLVIEDGGQYFNRMLVAMPDGQLDCYDKRHLFRMAGEDDAYTAGTARTIVDLEGWAIAPFVCYDLRFPVWTRRRDDYDVAIFVANWPAPRHDAWATLLKARAMENQAFVIGVNRVGTDGNGIEYPGGSVVLDYLGRELADCGTGQATRIATLSRAALDDARERFPVHRDADDFHLA